MATMTGAEAAAKLNARLTADEIGDVYTAVRGYMLEDYLAGDDTELTPATLAEVRAEVDALFTDREELTRMCLDLSLCPVHVRDYAICFDDSDPECDQVRGIHPGHDT